MEKICMVTNKSPGLLIYKIKEDGIRREFSPHETKKISIEELDKLAQQTGGPYLLYNYLYIEDPEVAEEIINKQLPPEYYLTEDKIPTWMESCSLEEFQDALDFAPEGTKDLIKRFAVSMPLNDYSKRKAILSQLGFDVTQTLENTGEENLEKPKETRVDGRRADPVTTMKVVEESKQRRVIKSAE